MTVSYDPTFVTTRTDIIEDAYANLNAFGVDEQLDSENYQAANRTLNRMIKSWMAQGYHLWLKETAYLFLNPGQNTYRLASSSSDHATLETDFYSTTLFEDAIVGATSVVVNDASGITAGDYIGVIVDGNDIFWTTVDSKVGTTINFPVGITLTTAASEGASVFTYTTALPKPLEVYSGVRNEGDRDIPLDYISNEEWFELPNKDSSSTPVSFSYDKQLSEAVIRLWPTPNDANTIVKLLLSREIYNFDVNSNTPDFPQEWHEAIVLNLSSRLAFPHRKASDQAYQELKNLAAASLNEALGFDNEQNSIYFQPNFRG